MEYKTIHFGKHKNINLIAWINSLFDEKFVSRSADPWDVYLALKGAVLGAKMNS